MLKNLLKLLIFLFALLIIFFSAKNITQAHAGAPFIYINGQITVAYPLFNGSALFKVPYVAAPKSYLVGEILEFKFDNTLLPIDSSLVNDQNLTWDFGDGTTLKRTNPRHSYNKTGSHIVTLNVKDPTYGNDVELESILINVLPDKNYQLPEAKIKVNGKLIQDPLKEPVSITNEENLELDASLSKGRIKNYKWDFGDGSPLSNEKKVKHSFRFEGNYSYSLFPILRIEDESGFISDTLIQVSRDTNSPENPTSTNSTSPTKNQLGFWILGAGAILILISLVFGLKFLRQNSKKPK